MLNKNMETKNIFSDYPDIVNVDDLAKMLNIGRNTAYRLLNNGSIKSIRIGRVHKIPKQNIITFLNESMFV